eukprot:2704092-Alexandrium_andersonii.AAC.1
MRDATHDAEDAAQQMSDFLGVGDDAYDPSGVWSEDMDAADRNARAVEDSVIQSVSKDSKHESRLSSQMKGCDVGDHEGERDAALALAKLGQFGASSSSSVASKAYGSASFTATELRGLFCTWRRELLSSLSSLDACSRTASMPLGNETRLSLVAVSTEGGQARATFVHWSDAPRRLGREVRIDSQDRIVWNIVGFVRE